MNTYSGPGTSTILWAIILKIAYKVAAIIPISQRSKTETQKELSGFISNKQQSQSLATKYNSIQHKALAFLGLIFSCP